MSLAVVFRETALRNLARIRGEDKELFTLTRRAISALADGLIRKVRPRSARGVYRLTRRHPDPLRSRRSGGDGIHHQHRDHRLDPPEGADLIGRGQPCPLRHLRIAIPVSIGGHVLRRLMRDSSPTADLRHQPRIGARASDVLASVCGVGILSAYVWQRVLAAARGHVGPALQHGLPNVAYDRPAILRLAGDVTGRCVLELGCAAGVLTRQLVDRGASVLALEPGAADG